MDHNITIIKDQIRIIPMTKRDSELYRKLRNRPEIRKWFFYSEVISEEAQDVWYEKYIKGPEYMFSIYLNEGDVFIGGVGIYDIDKDTSQAEYGRFILDGELVSGKGLGVQCVHAVFDAARSIGIKSLHMDVMEDNIASIKTNERAGFILVREIDNGSYGKNRTYNINL